MSEPLRANDPEAPDPSSGASGDATQGDLTLSELVQRARERAEAEAAVGAVMRREAEKEAKRAEQELRKTRTTPVMLVLCVILGLMNAYLWFSNPAWLRYNEPQAPTIEYSEASWKIAVYLQRQRIEEYRQIKGHIPATAQQAGQPVHGVQYTPIEMKDYRLAAGAGPKQVVYHSNDSLSVMMGRTLVMMGLVTGGAR